MHAETMPVDGTTMTVEEFLALPDDGVDRELIRGVVRVRRGGVPYHDPAHGGAVANLASLLAGWRDARPTPRGLVVCGGAGFYLRALGETIVGIDAAYVSPELVEATGPHQAIFDGPPVLAVEILSARDAIGEVVEKVDLYHAVGVIVWVVDPYFETVAVHRPGQKVESLNTDHELSGESYLIDFRARVTEFFA